MTKVAIAGYFDPFHEGHLELIDNAKKLGGYLIAMVNTPEQCIRKHRYTFHTWEGRAKILLRVGVNEVVAVQDDDDLDGSVAETLLRVKPNIYAVGEGYSLNNLNSKEIKACKEIGCKIVFNVARRLNNSNKYWGCKNAGE